MQKQKAVFWDRDGVLNHVLDRDGLKNVGAQKFEQFKLVEGVGKVLQGVKTLGFINIVATNQPDVSRNLVSWEELNRMHDFLKAQVPSVDAIYVCPHDGKDNCHCRKPKSGLLLDAAKDYHLDLSQSYMVGDTQKDIEAAKNAGVKNILLKTHYNSEVTGYDFSISSLSEIISLIS